MTVIVIRHLTKGNRDRAIYRGQSTIGYNAAARVVMLVGRNPENPNERVLAVIKNNLAPQASAIAFDIAEGGHFFWRGETDVTAEALLSPDEGSEAQSALSEAQSALEEARAFLTGVLAGGPAESGKVLKQAKALGISDRSLKRAKAVEGIKARRHGEQGKRGGGVWSWEVPLGGSKSTIKDANNGNMAPLIHTVSEDGKSRTNVGTLNPPERGTAVKDKEDEEGQWTG